jgi:copper chaperone CopZ
MLRPREGIEHMNELTLYVGGMGCRDCVREVTGLLRDVPGVQRVAADHRRSVVVLGGSMSRGRVLAALDGTRFQVDRITGNSSQTEGGQPSP